MPRPAELIRVAIAQARDDGEYRDEAKVQESGSRRMRHQVLPGLSLLVPKSGSPVMNIGVGGKGTNPAHICGSTKVLRLPL